jgi:hypothetical protein
MNLTHSLSLSHTHTHTINLRSTSLVPYHLCLGLEISLFPSSLPTKILYAFIIFITRATSPVYLISRDLKTLVVLGKDQSYQVSHYTNFSIFPLSPLSYVQKILLSTLLSNISVRVLSIGSMSQQAFTGVSVLFTKY